jgi:hypothetical protein
MTHDETESGDGLFDQVVQASGLASIIASVAIARACIRADVNPKSLTPESLTRVLPHLQQTLQHYLPNNVEHHISAIGALATTEPSVRYGTSLASQERIRPSDDKASFVSPSAQAGATMQIEATLSRDDISDILRQFVPLEIDLSKGGSGARLLAVDELIELTVVPDAGVRILCAAHIRWPVLGIRVPVDVPRLRILIIPSIRRGEGQEWLVFRLRIEDADIAWVPSPLDQGIAERLNRELAEHNVELAWNFHRALSHVFGLPAALTTAGTVRLEVAGGRLEIAEAALRLTVSFRAAVAQRRRA